MPFLSSRYFAAMVVALSMVAIGTGCSKPKPVVSPPVAPGNSSQKLTPTQVEARIKAVQDNQTIPAAAKPSIIESIRAQGQP